MSRNLFLKVLFSFFISHLYGASTNLSASIREADNAVNDIVTISNADRIKFFLTTIKAVERHRPDHDYKNRKRGAENLFS